MEKKLNILLVEDDPNLGGMLHEYLSIKGYHVDLMNDGQKGLDAFKHHSYDFLILDVMMPKLDGFSLASSIRDINKEVPILFLTAKSLKEDTLKGFEVGADDYMKKPFSMDELIARIEAILRRSGALNSKEDVVDYEIGKFHFNALKQTLSINGQDTKLTTKENELLKLMCKKGFGQLLDRNEALIKVWGDDDYYRGRSMDVYISKLRKYFKDDENVEIVTVHGNGFKLLVN